MRKKGIWSLEFTGKLILALIVLGISMFMIKQIVTGTNTGYDKHLCKMSVIANSKGRIAGTEFYTIRCPTRYVTIEQKKYTIEAKDASDEFDIECGNLVSDESKQCFFDRTNWLISNILFDCWDQFAAGQLSVFSRYNQDRQCLICARIEFKDVPGSATAHSRNKLEHSLEEYMKTHNPVQHRISYYEFIFDQTDAWPHKGMIYEYDLTHPMAVVFSSMNENYFTSQISSAWDKVKTVAFKEPGSDREYQFVNALDFVRYDEVIEQCDALR